MLKTLGHIKNTEALVLLLERLRADVAKAKKQLAELPWQSQIYGLNDLTCEEEPDGILIERKSQTDASTS